MELLIPLFVVLTISQVSLTNEIPRRCNNSSTTEDREAIRELFALVKDAQRSLLETDKMLMMCRQQLTNLEREQAKLSPPILIPAAFYVSLSQNVFNPEAKRPVLFDRETLDLTANYNPNDGKFTAKVPGVYSFSWTVATNYGQYLFATLMHNDFVTGRTIAGDAVDSSMATGTAILHMNEGDTVMVVVDQSSKGAEVMASMSALSGFFVTG
ncbi:complement C1q tumor necrosis factor-related protein 2-like [Mizuhopecten yessoensis]|uniref:Complement C1q tumor necrosis factor-related protein 2 n=1 Tax=Mizuhopecten yessoensis TaxID=6573 RepID=A0A210R5H5_MIZYE|nr:complement C1q tumor necrosis factor-related protein 2-like [Mizuhopecten yessoensis]OWF56279.1 Complement C1q tumor necrosis factor-related protein 2 [Mizuhopecten yessoensis]